MKSDKDTIKGFLKLSALERGMGSKEIDQLRRIMPKEGEFFKTLPSNEVGDSYMVIKPLPPESPVPWIGYVIYSDTIVMAETYSKYPTSRQIAKLKKKYDELCQK